MSTELVNLTLKDFRQPGILRFGVDTYKSIIDDIKDIINCKVVVISDKGLKNAGLVDKFLEIFSLLSIPVVTFTEISGEPTFETLRTAVKFIKDEDCNVVIGIGGGSALDVAKTSATLVDKEELEPYLSGEKTIDSRKIKTILVPTTSGTGSEVTMNAIFGDVEQEVKRGLVSPFLLPDLAIVDPTLTLSCPPKVTAASGVDAFAHAIESYIAVKATPLTKIYAEKAMKLFPHNIIRAVHNGNDIESRIGMSWVSVLAGISLANAGVGAVHALAYPLGGKYHIEHGVANALLMPYVFEVIGDTCLKEMNDVAEFLQVGSFENNPHVAKEAVVNYLLNLLKQLNLPTSLSELNIDRESLSLLANQASKVSRLLANTPYRLNESKILSIYENAFVGR